MARGKKFSRSVDLSTENSCECQRFFAKSELVSCHDLQPFFPSAVCCPRCVLFRLAVDVRNGDGCSGYFRGDLTVVWWGGNSGATLTNDFIEIFNPTQGPVSLTGLSVQYASSTGSSWQTTLLPSITLQPGQYALIQESQGAAGTTALPAPDATGTIAMSATSGKIALVSSVSALTGSCPTGDPNFLDFVGFGTAANCSLGSPTVTLSNTTAAIRTNVCANTNNNTDFKALAPAPHNTATPLAACPPSTTSAPPTVTGLATPASAFTGDPILLTATVNPGTLPASTGIQVSGNLSTIGGSSTQSFYDDGTHGDATSGDNIFSFAVTTSTTGSFAMPVTVTDSQLRSASGSIALTVTTPPQFVTIGTIQANKPSSYATQTVMTSGIVIGVKSNGFYLEAKNADTNPATPEGILVYTSSRPLPSFVQVGAEVQVTGTVNTFPATGLIRGTEIDGPQTFTLLSTGNPLPAPVQITAAMDSPSGGIQQFSRFEGMRVAIDSVTTSGTDASLNESTETNTSNGRFYGVVTGVPRPFREPGIGVTDTVFGPVPPGVPRGRLIRCICRICSWRAMARVLMRACW
jgi:predicted extracellular nuclease